MSAIFKREFRGLFRGRTGWICVIVSVLTAGILTAINNFLSLSTDASKLFPVLCDISILLCPFLAVHSVTFETVKGNSAWLASLPVSRWALIGGKFFAALSLFGICAVYYALFPLLIGLFGTVSYGTAYSALLGWFLITSATLSLSFFLTSRFSNRLVAFFVAVCVCLVLYFLPLLATLVSLLPWVGFLFLSLIGLGIAVPYLIRDIRASRVPVRAIAIFLPVCAVLAVLFFTAKKFYKVILAEMLDYISIYAKLDGFRDGHLDLTAVVFLITFTAFFLLLTVLLPYRKTDKTVRAKQ